MDPARHATLHAGYGQSFPPCVGHALGIEGHDAPSAVTASVTATAAGLTFTVEPGIYIPDLGGVRVAEGVDVLTASPREFRSLGPGADLLLKETRKTTQTRPSPITMGVNHNCMTVPYLRAKSYARQAVLSIWRLRIRAGREIDFLVTVDRQPWFAVEARLSATPIEPSLAYFLNCLRIPWAYQVVLEGKRDFVQHGIRCVPARQFPGALV